MAERRNLPVVAVIIGAALLVLRSAAAIVSTSDIDNDTPLTFQGAFEPYSWPDRIHHWATTPHPYGVLVQMVYVKATKRLPWDILTSWRAMIFAVLVVSVVLVIRAGRRDAAALITVALLLPAISRQYAVLEEEVVGMLLFGLAVYWLAKVGPGWRSWWPAYIAGLAVTLWSFQYMWALVAGAGVHMLVSLLRRDRRAAVLDVAYAAVLGGTMLALHAVGWVRYTPYQDDFESITRHLAMGHSLASWWPHVIIGFNKSLPGVTTGLDNWPAVAAGTVGFLALIAAAVWWSRVRVVAVLVGACMFPILYEPSSTERWSPVAVAIVLSLMFWRDWFPRREAEPETVELETVGASA